MNDNVVKEIEHKSRAIDYRIDGIQTRLLLKEISLDLKKCVKALEAISNKKGSGV